MVVFLFLMLLMFFGNTDADDEITADDLKRFLLPTEQMYKKNSKYIKFNEFHQLVEGQNTDNEPSGIRYQNSTDTVHDTRTKTDSNQNEVRKSWNVSHDPAGQKHADRYQSTTNNQKVQNNSSEKHQNDSSGGKKKKHTGKPQSEEKNSRLHKEKKNNEDRYIPPSWTQQTTTVDKIYSDEIKGDKKNIRFNIRIGTTFRAKLNRTTTNTESNLSELVVTQDVFGEFKTLPKGSKLFAEKKLNSGTNRLELSVIKGITPYGMEFKMKGIVFDSTDTAGLSGAIATDGKVLNRSVAKGALKMGADFGKLLNDGSIVGAATETVVDNVLDEKKTETDMTDHPQFVIYVNPQDVYIRIEETF